MYFLLTFVLIFLGNHSWSQAGELLTIEQAVVEAIAANPALKAAGEEAQAAKARIGVASSLADPMVGVEFEEVPISTSDISRGTMTNYAFIQELPFPTKLVTRRKQAKKNYLAQESVYTNEKINLIVAVEHAYHHFYLVEHSLTINHELQALFQKLAASEEAKYTTGKHTSQNFLKARVETEKLKSEQLLLTAERVEALAELNRLRNRNPKEEIRLAGLPHLHPLPSYEELEKKFFEKNPTLRTAQLQTESFKAQASVAKQEAWIPDLQARFAYNQRYGQQDAWTGGGMINIPFVWGKKRKEAKEAKAFALASRHALTNIQNEGLAFLAEAYAQFSSAEQSHQLFQNQILPQAQLALKSAEAAYQTGQDDFLSLIDAAREFKEIKLEALEALVDYHRSASHLKGAAGLEVL